MFLVLSLRLHRPSSEASNGRLLLLLLLLLLLSSLLVVVVPLFFRACCPCRLHTPAGRGSFLPAAIAPSARAASCPIAAKHVPVRGCRQIFFQAM